MNNNLNPRHNVLSVSRRKLLLWSTPVVVAITLPVHAQTSSCTPTSAATMTASVPSKCSGQPPVGQAVLTILSDVADPLNDAIEIRAISVSGAGAEDTITLPSLPANVIDTVGIDIAWSGPASDAVTCLPTSTIVFEVSYGCPGMGDDVVINFNMTDVLADAI